MASPNTPRSSPEQKFLEAPERHDDAALRISVDAIKKLITEGKSEATLRETIKDISIDGKTLDTIVINIDQLNRAKNGRVFTWKDGDAEKAPELGLIKNGSNLAQLIQLSIMVHHSSVEFQNFRKSLAGIDGNLERFTMQGLGQLIHHLETGSRIENLKRSMRDETIAKALKAMGVDVETTIRNTGSANNELRTMRELGIDVVGGSMIVTSYGQSSRLNLSDGKMYFGSSLQEREYPMNIHLMRDRDTANSPLVGESAVNRTNIHNAIKLMNLVHFTAKEYMNDTVRKSLRNTESPFYVDSNGELQVSNGMALIGMDTTIARRSTLNQLLSDARSASSISGEVLARFLNDIFRSLNPQEKIDRASTYVGGKKAISTTP